MLEGTEKPVEISNSIDTRTLKDGWELYFPAGRDAPERVFVPELKSWTEFDQEGIKYYSGIARYQKTFFHDINSSTLQDQRVFLDLGDFSNVAKVWLNDQLLGVAWAKPYRFDITEILKAGQNYLKIEVANTWSNRLVGDALTGKKFTDTNANNTVLPGLSEVRARWQDVPLLKSGLFGPVKIVTLRPVALN